jgi:Arc/MetJ family transcription regulator
MRTTIDIDEKLLEAAEKITGEKSPSKAVNTALRELVRRQKIRELREMLGTTNWEDNWKALEELELEKTRRREE